MTRVTAHFTRCFIAGIVALLPIGGVLLSVIWIESAISEELPTRHKEQVGIIKKVFSEELDKLRESLQGGN